MKHGAPIEISGERERLRELGSRAKSHRHLHEASRCNWSLSHVEKIFNFVWVIASYWDLTCGEATGMPTEHDWTQWIFGMALIAQCN